MQSDIQWWTMSVEVLPVWSQGLHADLSELCWWCTVCNGLCENMTGGSWAYSTVLKYSASDHIKICKDLPNMWATFHWRGDTQAKARQSIAQNCLSTNKVLRSENIAFLIPWQRSAKWNSCMPNKSAYYSIKTRQTSKCPSSFLSRGQAPWLFWL